MFGRNSVVSVRVSLYSIGCPPPLVESKFMALPDQLRLREINEIVECLNSCERKRIIYLCGNLDTDDSVVRMKEMLKRKVLCQDTGHLLLGALLMQLKRFDILRKVCEISRDEMERTPAYRHVLPKFRVLMANLSEDMDNEDVNSVKFLLGSILPREKTEKAKSFLDLIIELEKLDKVSPESVDIVEECLRNISRVDLARKVHAYKMSVTTPQQNEPQRQRPIAHPPFPLPNSSHPLPITRQGLSSHSAAENIPVSAFRTHSCQSQLDMYKFNTNPRGVCVIIDCVGNDGDMLEQTFQALHFKVLLYKWLSATDILSTLKQIVKQRENLEGDGFVCCIISRGTTNRLLGTDSCCIGTGLDSIRRLFTADGCPMLAGKPKLFFIQNYKVPEIHPHARAEDLETDGCDVLPRYDFIPTGADVFWSHCWTDDHQLEQGHHRSVYLKALTDALQKGQRRKTHLVDVHTEVNGAIFEHNKKNPGAKYHIDLNYTLRKDLYLG